ncbi:class I SAM-dependent methyltransferase [Chamaesiphon polymorphus]|uniref:SAM-dependent methyltransferase n=1 Tax=Chamaesiphon polymorphus CCALA 037 TaxID=2107692 RepID=A0A2T1G8B0_9CYAN|nr:class I SAM-dependent methyltransferase [Chamaesiphon polymorphus]PSB53386.1 SAM-dependent methyltransferase [Chamaesiphon polymorphus CCALA 037]
MTNSRSRIRELVQASYQQGDYTGWFEALYAEANGNADAIPWADRGLNYWLSDWIEKSNVVVQDRQVLVVGCGLGDDAEYLAKLGAKVTAFDLSQTAIDWCHQRFPDSQVNYQVADLFTAPAEWKLSFDLVIEIYTIQALPANIRPNAIECISNFVAPNGKLLVVCRGRNLEDLAGENPPFALTQAELNRFTNDGLDLVSFEDFIDTLESGSPRRFRLVYQR